MKYVTPHSLFLCPPVALHIRIPIYYKPNTLSQEYNYSKDSFLEWFFKHYYYAHLIKKVVKNVLDEWTNTKTVRNRLFFGFVEKKNCQSLNLQITKMIQSIWKVFAKTSISSLTFAILKPSGKSISQRRKMSIERLETRCV